MNNKQQLFVVRGSGFGIDGAIVVIDSEHVIDGEVYFSVNPYNPRVVGQRSVLISEKYLQPINNRLKTFIYTFTVSKKCVETGELEQDLLIIDNAFRNMGVKTILNRLNNELSSLLRLE